MSGLTTASMRGASPRARSASMVSAATSYAPSRIAISSSSSGEGVPTIPSAMYMSPGFVINKHGHKPGSRNILYYIELLSVNTYGGYDLFYNIFTFPDDHGNICW